MTFIREMVLFLIVYGASLVKASTVNSETVAKSMTHSAAVLVVTQHSFVVEGDSIYGMPLYCLSTLLLRTVASQTERLLCTVPVMPVQTHRPFT